MCELDECVFWEMRLVIDTSFRFDVWCLFLVHIFFADFWSDVFDISENRVNCQFNRMLGNWNCNRFISR